MISGLIGCSAVSGLVGGSRDRGRGRAGVERAGVLQRPVEVAFMAEHGVGHLLALRQADDDIGADALALDRAAGRRVVERRRQPQGAVPAFERDDRLHRALAKAAGAHDRRAVIVLQCAGDDFRGRGRGAVDQHHDRHPGDQIARHRGAIDAVVVGVAALGRDHDAAVDKFAGHIDRRVEQAAGIVAQIEDKARSAGHAPAA